MTLSAARQEASRNNGKKSRGPTSAAGKARSARNSTKHGLTGKGTCLPPELEVDRDARAASLADALQPADDAERLLIGQMALAAARIDASVRQESAHSAERRKKALEKFDAERDSHVAHRLAQLATDPAGAVEWLLGRAEGCDALSDLWDGLAEALADDGAWSPVDLRLAMQLHGIGDGQAPDAAGPEIRAMIADALALLPRPGGAAPADRRDRLRGYAESERDRLLALADELWESQDAPARAAVAARVTIGIDDASVRLRQYESAASSSLHRALRDLTALRKAQATAAKNEPEPRPAARPIAAANEPRPAVPAPTENEPKAATTAPAENEPKPVAVTSPAPAENEPKNSAATFPTPAENEPRPAADRPAPPPVTHAENEPRAAGRPWSDPPVWRGQSAA